MPKRIRNIKVKHEENRGKNKHAAKGKGWGDGQAAQAFHRSRKLPIIQRMSTSEFTTFRPRVANEPYYWCIRRWGDETIPNALHKVGFPAKPVPLSALLNSILEKLKIAVENTTEIDPETGVISIMLGNEKIIIE